MFLCPVSKKPKYSTFYIKMTASLPLLIAGGDILPFYTLLFAFCHLSVAIPQSGENAKLAALRALFCCIVMATKKFSSCSVIRSCYVAPG